MSQHENDALQVQGDRVVLGEWSGDLEELIAKNVELRQMLREGRADEARALLKTQAVEEQAALVAIDENPEEVLSLTGMDAKGRPGYLPAVVDKLPSEIIAELVAPSEHKLARFNTALLQTMSAESFARAVEDTLDPVYYHGNRTKVSWEWLEAVAALDDHSKRAALLYKVDQGLLEDAFLDKVDSIDMHAQVGGLPDWGTVSAFSLLSESGQAVMLPPINDPEIREVIGSLHQAAPELLAGAARRVGTSRWRSLVNRLAHVDLNQVPLDHNSFIGQVVAAGIEYEQLPPRFMDSLRAYLRVRGLGFAQRHRTGIALGRDQLRQGMEQGLACMDLALEEESGGDLNAAVAKLVGDSFDALYKQGWEQAFRRLEAMRQQARALVGCSELGFWPDLQPKVAALTKIVPETWTGPSDIDLRTDGQMLQELTGKVAFVRSLPQPSVVALLEQVDVDFAGVLHRVILALALGRVELTVKEEHVSRFRD